MTDADRARQAVKILLDGRDPVSEMAVFMVTLEHAVALALLVAMNLNHHKAVQMLNEGLVPGVESRLAIHAAKGKTK